MDRISVYNIEAERIEALAEKYDTTTEDIVECLFDLLDSDIEMNLRSEKEVFGWNVE